MPQEPQEGGESLSSQQIRQYQDAFDLFDKNKDGTIDQQELRTVMKALGHDPTQKELNELIDHVDVNKDGKIDFSEFVLIMANHLRHTDHELELIEIFKIFDKDNDGKISPRELKYILYSIGEELSDTEISQMIKEADLNQDGEVDIHEFNSLINSSSLTQL